MLRLPFLCILLSACTTLSGARPLAAGEHEVGLMTGGGLVEFGGPLPLPNIVAGGRSGVARVAERNLDAHYGVNLTALAFGLVQGHVGAGWFLVGDADSKLALSVVDRVFWGTSVFAPDRAPGGTRLWGANQIEFIGSVRTGNHVHSLGLAQYLDFGNPTLALTPSINSALDFGKPGGFVVQAELRWFGITQVAKYDAVTWIPGRPGILGVAIGTSVRF